MTFRLARLWWSLGIALVVLIAWLSLEKPSGGEALLPDKIAHGVAYFVLAVWFLNLLPRWRASVLVAVIAYGGLLEILQGMTPYRYADWLDLLADATGAVLALALLYFIPVNLFAWLEEQFRTRMH